MPAFNGGKVEIFALLLFHVIGRSYRSYLVVFVESIVQQNSCSVFFPLFIHKKIELLLFVARQFHFLSLNNKLPDNRRMLTMMTPVARSSSLSSMWLLVLAAAQLATSPVTGQVVYGDRFGYDTSTTRNDGFVDFGPAEWDRIQCDETTREGLDACIGYTDKWHEGQEWEIQVSSLVLGE
jgi:hypothetical protein